MSIFRYIDQTYIETPEFEQPGEGLTFRINLPDGQDILFVAEKEFYTPRRITTNLPEVVRLENIVEYAPNNVAIIKLANGQIPLTNPQYYLNSIVRDVYKQYKLDTFFTELDDELAIPEYVGTELEKRQLALTTLLNLEDLAVAAAIGNVEQIAELTDDIDNNFSELAGLEAIKELSPSEVVTPEEEDQLTSLDFVGLTTNGSSVPGGYASSPTLGALVPGIGGIPSGTGIGGGIGSGTSGGINDVAPGDTKIVRPDGTVIIAPGDPINKLSPQEREELGILDYTPGEEGSVIPDENGVFSSEDPSADIINPVPTVDETALIRMDGGLPVIAGEVPGVNVVNQAIEILNTGIQQIEGSMQGNAQSPAATQEDNCKTITIARGKKGFPGRFGIGSKPERKVSRADVENKLALVKADIAQQERNEVPLLKTLSGTPTLVKTGKSALFSSLMGAVARAGVLNGISKTVGAPLAITATTSAVPTGYQPMNKQQILNLLNRTKQELEKILQQGC